MTSYKLYYKFYTNQLKQYKTIDATTAAFKKNCPRRKVKHFRKKKNTTTKLYLFLFEIISVCSLIMLLQVVLFAVVFVSSAHCQNNDQEDYDYVDNHSGGFGDMYEWQPSVDDAIKKGIETGMPVMVIIHKAWCRDASKLKDSFLASTKIQSLSKKFIMVNTTLDEEVEGKELSPDGKYFPR